MTRKTSSSFISCILLGVFLLYLLPQLFEEQMLDLLFFVSEAVGYSTRRVIDNPEGIPVVNYGTIQAEMVGSGYNPVTISREVMKRLDKFKETGSSVELELALKNADWLVKNLKKNAHGINVWLYEFDYPRYNLKAPWYSGMAQGVGIEALVYTYEVTGNRIYLESAKVAFDSFNHDTIEGGVRVKCDSGYWYEEYVSPNIEIPYTLNGFMFSLIGIHRLLELTEDTNIGNTFKEGIDCLLVKIADFSIACDLWSYHNGKKVAASKGYHKLHISLLEELFSITGELKFAEYAKQWQRGLSMPNVITYLVARNRVNLLLFIISLVLSITISIVFHVIVTRLVKLTSKGSIK